MQTDWNENCAALKGVVAAEPEISHENHGLAYWRFPLTVRRLSGAEDCVNVIASRALLAACPATVGRTLDIRGEVRSFNNRSGTGSRLVITLFARSLQAAAGEHENTLHLAGVLCKAPVLRRTPLGRDICDLMLAVNRRYGRADYLPCIAWGTLAQKCGGLAVGDGVALEGRLQSRKYRKTTEAGDQERTAFEISVMTLEKIV